MSAAERVAIRAIAAGGDGVGTLADGRTVFVPRSAPGDELELRDVRRHARFARATILRIDTPGPGRVEAPCPHYDADRCGGCQLMHLDAATQLAAKARIAGDAIRRIAGLSVEDPPITAAPESLGYRSKVTFAWRHGRLGYHRLTAPDEVFAVHRCLLLEPGLDDVHQRLRTVLDALPDDATHVTLRRDAAGTRHVIVRTSGKRAWSNAAPFAAALGRDVVTWWHPEGGAARAVAGSDSPWPATVFEQVHPAVATAVRRHAVERVADGRAAAEVAWDLYAGIGESTALLAGQGFRVESVELNPRAVALAERLGPTGPRRLAGDVADRIGALTPPGVVLTNPPRTGMAEPVTRVLAGCGAARIVYVSCDPGTLARDLKRLASHYRLADLGAWDQFPQTAHLECVAVLERR